MASSSSSSSSSTGRVVDAAAKAATQQSQTQQHPEDDDVLSSIRAIKEMVEKEFSLSEHNRRSRLSTIASDVDDGDGQEEGNADATTTTNNNNNNNNNSNIKNYNSWKNQCYRLKQELYEIKNKDTLELKQKTEEIHSLKKHLNENQIELKSEIDMKTILEDTLTSQNIHTQTIVTQLNISKENQKLLQNKLSNLLISLEEEKQSIGSERLTSKQLLEEKQFFVDDINKRADIEEIKRIRIESELRTMKTKIQQQNIIIEKQIQDASKVKKIHAESIQRMNELLEKSVAAQQQQQKDNNNRKAAVDATASAAAGSNDFKTDLVIKALKVQVKRLTESNTKLLYEKDKAAAAAAAVAAVTVTTTNPTPTTGTSQILFELESSKKQMNIIQELKKTIQLKKLEKEQLLLNYEKEKLNGIELANKLNNVNANANANANVMIETTTATTAITAIDTSAEPTTTSLQKKLHVLEAALVKDSNTIKSLENQISSIEKQSQKTPSKQNKRNSNAVVVLTKKKHLLDGMKKQHRSKSIQVSSDIVNLQLKRLVEIQRGSTPTGNNQQEWDVAIKKLSENHSRIITLRHQEEKEEEKEGSSSNNGCNDGGLGGGNNNSNDKTVGSGGTGGGSGSGSGSSNDNNNKKKKSVLPLSTTTPFKKKTKKNNNTNTTTTTTTATDATDATAASATATTTIAGAGAGGDAVQRRKRTSTSANTTSTASATGDDNSNNNNNNNNNSSNNNNNAKRMKKTN
jgi:hypothetical protein